MKKAIIFIFIIFAIILSGCQALSSQVSLTGSSWTLSQLNGRSLIPGSHIEIHFNQDTISGFGGCNSYGGGFQTSGDRFSVAEAIESTAMACLTPEGVGEQETEYFLALRSSRNFEVSGNRLEIYNNSGEIGLVFLLQKPDPKLDIQSLMGSSWQVSSIQGEKLIPGSKITMSFTKNNHVEGFGGCRNYQAEYVETDEGIRFTSIGMVEETCNQPDLLVQEQDFTDYFTWADHFELVEETLILVTQRGEEIIFRPIIE